MDNTYLRDFARFFDTSEPTIHLVPSYASLEVGRVVCINARVTNGRLRDIQHRHEGEAWQSSGARNGGASIVCRRSGRLEIRALAQGESGETAASSIELQVRPAKAYVSPKYNASVNRHQPLLLSLSYANTRSLRLEINGQAFVFPDGDLHTEYQGSVALPSGDLGEHIGELNWISSEGDVQRSQLRYNVLPRRASLQVTKEAPNLLRYQLANAESAELHIPALQLRQPLDIEGHIKLYWFSLPAEIAYTDESGARNSLPLVMPAIQSPWSMLLRW